MFIRNKSIHRSWLILFALIMVQGGIIGVYGNTLGIVFSAIRSDLGFRAGDLSIYYMLRSITSGFTVGITTRLLLNDSGRNFRKVMCVLALLMGLSYGAMALFSHLWQWYIAAVFFGIGQSANSVMIPIILRNWFRKNIGLAIGIAMSSSGIFGAIFSPVCSSLIGSFGWRTSCLIIGAVASVMIVIPVITILVVSPETVHENPYGAEEISDNTTQTKESRNHEPLPSWIFLVCLFSILFPSSIIQFSNQIPTFAQVIGYSLAYGATLTSITMIGNLFGKLLLGFLADRIGVIRSFSLFMLIMIAAMSMMLFCQGSQALLSGAFILYGFGYSIATTGPGLLFPDVYGPENYREKLSRYSALSMFIFAGLSVIFPYIYDFTGSFNPVFVYGIASCILALILFYVLQIYSAAKKN